MPEPSIRIVHLVWAPLGAELLRGFMAALDAHPPGAPFRLSVVLNGFEAIDDGPWRALLDGRDADVHRTPEALQDLGAYAHAARETTGDLVCLMNSYARPLRDGWLAALRAPLGDGFGATGATGSYESLGSRLKLRDRWHGGARDRLGGLYDWAAYRVRYPRFPNPHLRTNGLLCRRTALLEAMPGAPPRDKPSAYLVESGRRGISRRLGELAVVGRDGTAYRSADWPASRTFRSGEQENLLIADNRTAEWDGADAATRAALAARVWGKP